MPEAAGTAGSFNETTFHDCKALLIKIYVYGHNSLE